MARPFREYDFYAGIYDALMDFAVETCPRSTSPECVKCVANKIKEAVQRMELDQPDVAKRSPAGWVIRKMLEAELAASQQDPLGKAFGSSRPNGTGQCRRPIPWKRFPRASEP